MRASVPKTMTAASVPKTTASDLPLVKLTAATMSRMTPTIASRLMPAARSVERLEYKGLRRHAAQAPVIRQIAKMS
jgi:hypothetical protein